MGSREVTHILNPEDEDAIARKSAGRERSRLSSCSDVQSLAQAGTAPRWPETRCRQARTQSGGPAAAPVSFPNSQEDTWRTCQRREGAWEQGGSGWPGRA